MAHVVLQANVGADQQEPEAEQQDEDRARREEEWGREVQGPTEPQLTPTGAAQPATLTPRGARVSYALALEGIYSLYKLLLAHFISATVHEVFEFLLKWVYIYGPP